jgi:hypothetical protein
MKGKKMTKAGEAREPYVAEKTILIQGGKPQPDQIYVLPRAVVRFTNEDPQDYVIRLYAEGGETIHPIVELFLAAYESGTFVAGLEEKDQKGDCHFYIFDTPAATIGTCSEAPEKAVAEVKDATKANATSKGRSGGSGTVHVGGN